MEPRVLPMGSSGRESTHSCKCCQIGFIDTRRIYTASRKYCDTCNMGGCKDRLTRKSGHHRCIRKDPK